jgi:hypothetical protein
METVRIRDPGWKKVGSGIRDKHPGSATPQRDVVYLGLPIAPLCMSPNAVRGGVAGSQSMSTAEHMDPKYTLEF